MKKQTLLLAGAACIAALGLSSCKKDLNSPENASETGGKAYVAFSITLPNLSDLRAGVDGVNHGETYNGTIAEQIVKKARVVLYNEADICRYVFEINADNVNATGDGLENFGGDVSTVQTPTQTTFTTKAQEADRGNYTAYLFLNPTTAVETATAKGKTIDDLNAAANFTLSTVVSGTSGILMSNAKGGVAVTAANFKQSAAEAEAVAAAVKVPVERVVAKIFVNSGAVTNIKDEYDNDVADAAVRSFAVNVTNKKYFFVRQMDFTSAYDAATPNTDPESATTARIDSYAKDPNMGDATMNFGAAGKTKTDFASEFTYITAFPTVNATPALLDQAKKPGYDDINGIYVPENTMAAAYQYELGTTQVIVEIPFEPAVVSAETDKSFVNYRGQYIKVADFKTAVTKAQDATLPAEQRTDDYLGMPNGFVAEVTAAGFPTLDYTKSFVQGNINYYKDGIAYYKINVRHFTDTQVPWTSGALKYGRYGVVRNNIYKITISSIMGVGTPTIPEPDPETPDDQEKYKVAFSVEMQPWLVREMSVDL